MSNLYGPSAHPFPSAQGSPSIDQLTDWGRLCRNQPLGKTVVVGAAANDGFSLLPLPMPSQVPILQLQGDDRNALNLCVTISPPKLLQVTAGQLAGNLQALSGFQSIQDIADGSGDVTPNNSPITLPDLAAIVEWGIGGTNQRAQVDVANGATVNLAASYLRVFGLLGWGWNLSFHVDTAIQLGAEVSSGWGRGGGCRRTIYGALNGNGTSDVYAVPAFARSVQLLGCPITAGAPTPGAVSNLTIAFLTGASPPISGGAAKYLGEALAVGNTQNQIPIPGGAPFFTITEGSNQLTNWAAIFELSI